MADNLISANRAANRIYKHFGATNTIITSFSSPAADVRGLTFDGTNLISADSYTNKIYIHSGISSNISDSFAGPGPNPLGLAFDETNLMSSDWTADKIYIHSGVTSTITSSFASPENIPTGLTYDGTNLISGDTRSLLSKSAIFVHSGVSSNIIESFLAPCFWLQGLTYDGANLISQDGGLFNRIYKHSGVTSTIETQFFSPCILLATGLTYDNISTVVEIKEVTNITGGDPSIVTANGEITSIGNETVIERGFEYGLTETNTWEIHETGTFGIGVFSLSITDLSSDTTYYVRAYAKTDKGINYSEYIEFKTAYPFQNVTPEYNINKIEIKAEAIASDADIAKVGGRRTLTIRNHLIQSNSIAQSIADSYLAEYKDQKTKFVIKKANPPPYEIGDFIEMEIAIE